MTSASGRPQRAKRTIHQRKDESEIQPGSLPIPGAEYDTGPESSKRQRSEDKAVPRVDSGLQEELLEKPGVGGGGGGHAATASLPVLVKEKICVEDDNDDAEDYIGSDHVVEASEEETEDQEEEDVRGEEEEDEEVDTASLVEMLEGEDEEVMVEAPLGVGFRVPPPQMQKGRQAALLDPARHPNSHGPKAGSRPGETLPSERMVGSGRVGETQQLLTLEGRPLQGPAEDEDAYDLPTQACVRGRMQMIASEHMVTHVGQECSSLLFAALKQHMTNILQHVIQLRSQGVHGPSYSDTWSLPDLHRPSVTCRDLLSSLEIQPFGMLGEGVSEHMERISILRDYFY